MSDRPWTSEGVIIAMVTAAGYWCAYLFELGYCRFFDIPSDYVEVGVANILFAMAGIGSLLLFGVFYLEGVFGIYRSLPGPLRDPVRRLALVSLVMFGIGYASNLKLSILIYAYSAILSVFILLEFVYPLFSERKVNGYLNKLEAARATDMAYDSATDVFAQMIGRNAFSAIFLLCIASFISYVAGGIDARQRRVFAIPASDSNSVVLKRNSDYYVIAKFDREKKLVSRQFSLVPATKGPFEFTSELVGPLSKIDLE